MSIQKITLATALLLTLTACSSGGKGTDHTARQENAKLQTQVKALQQKAEEAQKKADLATERAKKAEQAVNSASKNAKEIEALKREAAQAKAEVEKAKQDAANALNNIDGKIQDALKRAEEEQIKADKARQENIKNLTKVAEKSGLNRWQAQDLAHKHSGLNEQEFSKFLVERKAKIEELNKLAIANGLQDWQADNFASEFADKEKSEAEAELKKRKEERIAYENKRNELKELALANGMQDWEADNFSNEFADKEKSEAEARLNKRKEFIAIFEDKGLLNNDHFVSDNLNLSKEEFIKKLDECIAEITFDDKRRQLNSLTITTPLGFHGQFEERTVPIFDDQGFDTGKTKLESYKDIYNQQFSIVVGRFYADSPNYRVNDDGYHQGFTTAEKSMPTEGSATYQGVAFTHNKQGKLNYTVNFSTKEGEGKITELSDIGTITLEKGTFGKRYNNHYMSGVGNAVAEDWKNDNVTGKYRFDFHGPKAEEIAGKVTLTQDKNYYGTLNPAYTPEGNEPMYFESKKLRDVATENGYNYGNTESFEIGFGGTRGEIKK